MGRAFDWVLVLVAGLTGCSDLPPPTYYPVRLSTPQSDAAEARIAAEVKFGEQLRVREEDAKRLLWVQSVTREEAEAEASVRRKRLTSAYWECIRTNTLRIAVASEEPAAIVAIAALSTCVSHEVQIQQAFPNNFDIVDDRFRRAAIGLAVQARIGRSRNPIPPKRAVLPPADGYKDI